MSGLDRIVKVVITRETRGIASANFDTLLHISDMAVGRVKTYADAGEVAEDYPTTSPTYLASLTYFSQTIAPRALKIGGRLATSIATTITGTITSGKVGATVYTDGSNVSVEVDFITDHDTTMTALASAIALASSDVSTAVYATGVLTVTPTANAFLYVDYDWSLSTPLLTSVTVANNTETLVDVVSAIVLEDNDWYGVTVEELGDSAEIVSLATWCGANKKFLFGGSNDTNVADTTEASDTTTLPARLNVVGANKSMVFYDKNLRKNDSGYGDVAFASMALSRTVGSYTTVLQALVNVNAGEYTSTQRKNLMDKNVSIYNILYGRGITEGGRVCDGNTPANGEWIDVEIGLDLYEVRIQEFVYATMASANKIAYTDTGIAIIESAVTSVLQKAVDDDFFAVFSIEAERASAQSAQDKASRIYNGIKWDATLSGAIHSTTVYGTVRV